MRVGFVCMIESIFFLHIIKRNANILRADILAKYLNDDSIGIDIKWLRMNYKLRPADPSPFVAKLRTGLSTFAPKGSLGSLFMNATGS